MAGMLRQMAPGVDSAPAPDLSELLDDGLWQEDTDGLSTWIEEAAAIPSTVPGWPEGDSPAQVAPGTASSQQLAAQDAPPEGADAAPALPLPRLLYHVLADRTAAIVVTAGGEVTGHVVALGRQALAQRVTELRQALQVENPRGMEVTRETGWVVLPEADDAPEPEYASLLRALYDDLVAPVAAALPADGTPVAIEPHGPLWLLPFAALQDPDGAWMADRWPLLYTPSHRVLDEIRREEDYGGPQDLVPLIVGNPTMPTLPSRHGRQIALQPLPGAEREARAVHALFDGEVGTLLTGDAADWATVVALMPQHGIVHLATHGIADAEDPLASTVALAVPDEGDMEALRQREAAGIGGWTQSKFLREFAPTEGKRGLLTARQVLYLPLPADLVVLSACQTGLGQVSGDGMIGLSRSFLVAGARSVLVSQWSVSDAATAALMAAFHRLYIEADDKAIALQAAMQAVRAQARYAHPRYWAPFVLVGAET
jgi:CHAT domain-containing protein